MGLKSKESLAEVLKSASVFLEAGGLDGQLAQAYWLRVFDWSLTDLVRQLHQPAQVADVATFEAVLARLVRHEPLQYILGYEDFDGRRFQVTPDTLIPREDTTGLLDLADAWLADHPGARRALDVGTGTGILAVSLAKRQPQLQVDAGDISLEALAVAQANAARHEAAVAFYPIDVCQGLPQDGRRYDLVLSNPPYISLAEEDLMDESVKTYEPALALFAENDGLAFYQALAQQLPDWLAPEACLLVEIGFRQADAVTAIFQAAFPGAAIHCYQDLNGHDRYIQVLRKEGTPAC